ncbi:hypothetical protein HELRODRAFT_178402 [Helobdella robusta]|uniref:Uncharacterized protein n=1 Tax=Helobdella robusta TaxID=6412 RepID=T1FD45_HELRO|nr:hypothetical protein HELRODRAFT_178402 [Helobdella robusta]ESN97274.1 hypothetical protein HELRODRAFT_178402 [Helobdella robusta]
MSVLMNAVSYRKALKAASRKVKKKCPPIKEPSRDDGFPPASSEQTSVWFWILNGVQTTVMFGKDDGEIKEDQTLGFVIEFNIELDETKSNHKGNLIVSGEGSTLLTVDGVMIPKYKGN